jgi:hypothetical protein
MRKAVDSRLSATVSLAVFVATVCTVAFLWVWIGQWSLSASAYPDTGEWWREFVLPRAAWSLLVGIPLGALVAVLLRQPLTMPNRLTPDGERTDRS